MSDSYKLDMEKLIADLCAAQDAYREAHKKAEELKRIFDAQQEAVLHVLAETNNLQAKAANLATVTAVTRQVPNAIDWDSVNRFVLENEATYLFQRRLNASAVQELVAQGIELPGVELVDKTTLSIKRL